MKASHHPWFIVPWTQRMKIWRNPRMSGRTDCFFADETFAPLKMLIDAGVAMLTNADGKTIFSVSEKDFLLRPRIVGRAPDIGYMEAGHPVTLLLLE